MKRVLSILFLILFPTIITMGQDSQFALPSIEAEKDLPGEGMLRRYAGYVNTWQRLRSQWATEIQKDQNAVVFLGDSITQGWTPNFRGNFAGMKLANRGIGGDTTRGMLIRLEQDVLSLNPAAVVMLMGTNDIEVQIAPEMIARNFKEIIEALKKHNPKMPIVLCRMFPSSASKKRPTETIQKVNQLYDNIVRNDKQVTVVDTFALFDDGNGDALPAYLSLIHI